MNRLSPEIHIFFKNDVIESLNSNKIYSVLDFIKTDIKVLEKIAKVPFKDVLEARKALLKQYSARPVNGLNSYRNLLTNSKLLSTGIENVDKLLDGGLMSGNIYELCGLPASCKTLFCLSIIRNVVTKSADKIYFLDTKQNFCARKLKSLLDLEKDKLVDALKNVRIKQFSTKYELVNALFGIKSEIENGLKVPIIIVDSLPVLLLDTTDNSENNNILSHVASIMRYLANECHICFFVTNIVTLWNEGDFKNQNEYTEKIACGKFWYDIPNVRLKIEKAGGKCKIKVLNGSRSMVRKGEVYAEITDNFGLQ